MSSTVQQFSVSNLHAGLQRAAGKRSSGDSVVLLGSFNADMGNISVTWKGEIWGNNLFNLNLTGVTSLCTSMVFVMDELGLVQEYVGKCL